MQERDQGRRLRQITELLDEYELVAERTSNGDLIALVFQLREVLRDDPESMPEPTKEQ